MVTNCHVLRGATAAKAVFSDGQVTDITGTLLIDENRDIVVARLAIANRPKLIFSTALPRKGDSVVALGAPHGLAFTATRGIVSAIRDAGEMSLELDHPSIEGMWIQVDAALSPGNSGGPLINDAGQVIAMSTLASRGTAQNLNFGISAKDMHDAVGVAWGRSLVTLSDGVGRLADPASSAGQPSDPRSSEAEITDLAMQEYFDECKNSFARLARDLRSERARLAGIFAGMRRGATTIPANLDDGSDVLRTIHPRSNNITWYFRSQSIKNRELTRMESRIEEQDRVRADVKSADDPNSILTLATQYGAPLDPRRLHSVGFINDAIVVHPLSDHELAILYDEAVYLLIVPTTVGLSLGQDVGPRPVFVGGTVTVSVKNQPSSAVTVLLSIDESQLRRVMNLSSESSSTNATPNTTPRIGGSAEQPAASTVSQLNTPLSAAQSSYRVWKDLTGKFSVEAQLQSFDGTKVKLRRRDGPVIEVPVSSLSDADRQFLKTQ
jgi:hypothetical protein